MRANQNNYCSFFCYISKTIISSWRTILLVANTNQQNCINDRERNNNNDCVLCKQWRADYEICQFTHVVTELYRRFYQILKKQNKTGSIENKTVAAIVMIFSPNYALCIGLLIYVFDSIPLPNVYQTEADAFQQLTKRHFKFNSLFITNGYARVWKENDTQQIQSKGTNKQTNKVKHFFVIILFLVHAHM